MIVPDNTKAVAAAKNDSVKAPGPCLEGDMLRKYECLLNQCSFIEAAKKQEGWVDQKVYFGELDATFIAIRTIKSTNTGSLLSLGRQVRIQKLGYQVLPQPS